MVGGGLVTAKRSRLGPEAPTWGAKAPRLLVATLLIHRDCDEPRGGPARAVMSGGRPAPSRPPRRDEV